MTEDVNPLKDWIDKHKTIAGVDKPTAAIKSCCGNCRFSSTGIQLNQLGCIRYPPQLLFMPPNQLITQFPVVRPEQLCGEWQPKLN